MQKWLELCPSVQACMVHVLVITIKACRRYWDFMSSSRWNSQWKKHGQAGPSPFAATPSHRNQWQAQLGKLKQKAAFRRAKQQAQPSEAQPRSAENTANRSDGFHNMHQQSHQQADQQQQRTPSGDAVEDSDNSMQQAQPRADQQHSQTVSVPSPCAEQLHPQHERSSTTQQDCDTVSSQETSDADHSVNGGHQEKYTDTLNELRSSHSDQAYACQSLHSEGTESDCMDPIHSPVHKAGRGSTHQADDSQGAVHGHTYGHDTDESVDAAHGPASYSYTSEDSSHTATDRVQSQLLGLRRRAARKAAA